jgi:hypothetical protein
MLKIFFKSEIKDHFKEVVGIKGVLSFYWDKKISSIIV